MTTMTSLFKDTRTDLTVAATTAASLHAATEETLSVQKTSCCVVGGGPGGAMLALAADLRSLHGWNVSVPALGQTVSLESVA